MKSTVTAAFVLVFIGAATIANAQEITLIDLSAEVLYGVDTDPFDDSGLFSIRFRVLAAKEMDIQIVALRGIAGNPPIGFAYIIENSANQEIISGAATAALSWISGGNKSGNIIHLNEGEKGHFRLQSIFEPESTGYYHMELYGLNGEALNIGEEGVTEFIHITGAPNQVPEPTAAILLSLGSAFLFGGRRKRVA